ncbi:MAG: pilin, partial [Burkholderiales bacterium]|nr:pilin [Burkholderiales bacterium]
WGCESTNPSKYVASVSTNANGVITVTTSADPSLKDAVNTSITLTPKDSTGAALTAASIGSTQVYQWSCGPAGTSGLPPKYLPGSCRG